MYIVVIVSILTNCFQAKYKDCKEEWSFCIPGFQVYDLLNSLEQPRKYDKEFGKSLDPGKVISGIIWLYIMYNNKIMFIILCFSVQDIFKL